MDLIHQKVVVLNFPKPALKEKFFLIEKPATVTGCLPILESLTFKLYLPVTFKFNFKVSDSRNGKHPVVN